MNKKGYFDIEWFVVSFVVIPAMVLFGLLFIYALIAVPHSMYKGYKFNKEMGSYCDLAYSASDIHKKLEYFDTCVTLIEEAKFTGYSAWWFKKPSNKLSEQYEVMESLQLRMHNLKDMKKDSFEYQTGLAQVEEEIAYFVGTSDSTGSVIKYFSRAYCFRNTWTIYLC